MTKTEGQLLRTNRCLTINQENIDAFDLKFGEKFMEMLLATAMEMISGNMRKSKNLHHLNH